jgi:hypothetical protein
MGSATFTISAPKLITIDAIPSQNYTGGQITPDIAVRDKDGKTMLAQGTDYTVSYGENLNAGDHAGSVAITGMGAYAGSKGSATFAIAPRTFTIQNIAPQTRTGSQIMPAVTVKDGERTLTAGTDYTVTYGENIDAGTGSIAITGMGVYAGSKGSATFIIRRPREMILAVNTGASAFGNLPFGEINKGYANVLGAETTWYMNRMAGIGLKWNMQTGEALFGEATYNEKLTFVGPALYLRWTNQKRFAVVASAGAGALNWKWSLKSENEAFDESATSFGGFFAAGVNLMATKHLGFSLNLQTIAGKATSGDLVRKPAAIGGTVGVNFRF